MSLYRIAFVADSQARSVVRELAVRPVPGDELTLDPTTVVAVREVVTLPTGDTITGDTITAEIVAETVRASGAATGSASRNSR